MHNFYHTQHTLWHVWISAISKTLHYPQVLLCNLLMDLHFYEMLIRFDWFFNLTFKTLKIQVNILNIIDI